MSSQEENPSAAAMRMLTSLGLELKDLALLADIPDELITEETLPRLLLQIKNNRTAKETGTFKQDTARTAETFRLDAGLPFDHHSNQRMELLLRRDSPPVKESSKLDLSPQRPVKQDLPRQRTSKWDIHPSTSTYNVSLTSEARADLSPHPNTSFYQSSTSFPSSTPKPSPTNYPSSTHYPSSTRYPSSTPYPRPTNYPSSSHHPSSTPYPKPTYYPSSTPYPSPIPNLSSAGHPSSTDHPGSTSNPHTITYPRPTPNPSSTSHASSFQSSSPHLSAIDVFSGSGPLSKTPVQLVQYPLDHCSRTQLPQHQAATAPTPVRPQKPPDPLNNLAAQLNTIMAAGLFSASMACYYGVGLNFDQRAVPSNSGKSDSDSKRDNKRKRATVSVPSESLARDFYGNAPVFYPYKCSLCFFYADSEASWCSHVSEERHTDKMLDLLKRYPDWDCRIESTQDVGEPPGAQEVGERPRRRSRRSSSSSSSWSGHSSPRRSTKEREIERERKNREADERMEECLVIAGFSQNAIQKKDLLHLLGSKADVVGLHVYDRFAILRMSTPESAKKVVDGFLKNPVVNLNVVSFEPLPSGKDWSSELTASAMQFGPVRDSLFLPTKAFIEMSNITDAKKLVEHHQTNALQLEGQTVDVYLSSEFFSLKYVSSRKQTEKSSKRKRSTHSRSRSKSKNRSEREKRATERSLTPGRKQQTEAGMLSAPLTSSVSTLDGHHPTNTSSPSSAEQARHTHQSPVKKDCDTGNQEPDFLRNLENCITLDEPDESSPDEERPDDDPEVECGLSRVLVFRNLSQSQFADEDFLKVVQDYGKVTRYILLHTTQEALVEMCSSSTAMRAAREIHNKKTSFMGEPLMPRMSKKYKRLLPGWSGSTAKEPLGSKPNEISSETTGQEKNLEEEKTKKSSVPIPMDKKTKEEERLSGNTNDEQRGVCSEKSSDCREVPGEARAVKDPVLSVTDPENMDETNRRNEEEMENEALPSTASVEQKVEGMMEVKTKRPGQQEGTCGKVPEEGYDAAKPQTRTRGRRKAARGEELKLSVIPVDSEKNAKLPVTRITRNRTAVTRATPVPECEPTPKTHRDPEEDVLLSKRAKRYSSTKRTTESKGTSVPRTPGGPASQEGTANMPQKRADSSVLSASGSEMGSKVVMEETGPKPALQVDQKASGPEGKSDQTLEEHKERASERKTNESDRETGDPSASVPDTENTKTILEKSEIAVNTELTPEMEIDTEKQTMKAGPLSVQSSPDPWDLIRDSGIEAPQLQTTKGFRGRRRRAVRGQKLKVSLVPLENETNAEVPVTSNTRKRITRVRELKVEDESDPVQDSLEAKDRAELSTDKDDSPTDVPERNSSRPVKRKASVMRGTSSKTTVAQNVTQRTVLNEEVTTENPESLKELFSKSGGGKEDQEKEHTCGVFRSNMEAETAQDIGCSGPASQEGYTERPQKNRAVSSAFDSEMESKLGMGETGLEPALQRNHAASGPERKSDQTSAEHKERASGMKKNESDAEIGDDPSADTAKTKTKVEKKIEIEAEKTEPTPETEAESNEKTVGTGLFSVQNSQDPCALTKPVVWRGMEMELNCQQEDSGKLEEEETKVGEHCIKVQVEQNSYSAESDPELDDPGSPVGIEFIYPVTGYFCDLCEVICVTEDEARDKHCTSLSHRQMLKKHASEKNGSAL
ncbi:uncharacterized protein LOC130125612 isoform X1 [Lampris incognitus]|uniref:uncharacterized protein LOC130125612 isoform X1 n=1 Tax=Lampris incognitus TaxID=2546036 RepID=UPI0024B55833|nr:uncharacterized protein LOC130125612 isoform X1 [Lampris incognitus]XP_056151168.1 uncharacterized protein LOC130125612 isoform X1 [Lampris incognitus]XP_056151169.1 uncharacterized protein LOC130125612 isoform X1 [Lampris incognitus]